MRHFSFPSALAESDYRHAPARIAVFSGPSLSVRDAAQALPGATCLPPIRRGDLPRVVREGFRVVAIVDGTYINDPTVSGHEILAALAKGVHLYGAASIGAVRAVEYGGDGFIGVGTIHSWFRHGLTYRDDEIVVPMDPETYSPLATPLVNIRFACQEALRRGILEATEADALLALAQEIPYDQRGYTRLEARARAQPRLARAASRLSRFTRSRGRELDLKRRDALELLGLLGRTYLAAGARRRG